MQQSIEVGDPDIGQLAWALGKAGQRAQALEIESKILAWSTPRRLRNLVYVYIGLGENDSALATLERAVDERSEFTTGMPNLAMPILDPIRSDPRFARIVKKLGLEGMQGLLHP